MKIFILPAFVLLFSVTGLSGQNALFLPFGKTEKGVKDILESREYFRSTQTMLDETLVLEMNNMQKVYYNFHEYVLYSIEDSRVYTSKRQAERTIQSCMKFLKGDKEKVQVILNKANESHYATIYDKKIVELHTQYDKELKQTVITLKVTSRMHGPRMQTEAFIAGLN